jgi:signal transduction histidine kinase
VSLLKTFWNIISNNGIYPETRTTRKHRISLVNQFATFSIAVNLVCGVCNLYYNLHFAFAANGLSTLVFFSVLVLNYHARYSAAMHVLILTVNILIFVLDGYFGRQGGTYAFFFPLMVAVGFIVHEKKISELAGYTVLPIVLLTIAEITNHSLFQNEPIGKEAQYVTFLVNNIMCVVLFNVIVYTIVTRYRSFQHSLQASETNIRFIMEHNSSAQWLVSRNLTLTEYNSRAASFFKQVFHTTLKKGAPIKQFISIDEHWKIFSKRYELALSGNQAKYSDHYTNNGDDIYMESTFFPVVDEDGLVLAVSVQFIDVTEQKNKQEKLITQNQALTKLNKELDSFVYSVSHDLRSPIASVLGLIHLSQKEQDIQRIREYLGMKEKSLRRLDSFIKDILDYSRNNRQDVKPELINLHQLTQQVIESNLHSEEAQKVDIISGIDDTSLFASDRRRISIILNNLVSNAVRYSDFTKPRPFVKIELAADEQHLGINIIDNGVGIKNEHLGNIYKMFYRASSNKVGSGLGLYIVKETIDKLGGTIEVESDYGQGTLFSVTIPNLARKLNIPSESAGKLPEGFPMES